MVSRRFFIHSGIVLAVIAGLFLFRELGFVRSARQNALRGFVPLMEASTFARRALHSWFAEENALAPALARIRDGEIDAFREENRDLRALLDFRNNAQFRLVNARVLLYGADGGGEFLLIDKGLHDGVRDGDSVMTPDRMVLGRIAKSGDAFAHVVIASNKDETYEGEIFSLGVPTLARGIGARAFELDFVAHDVLMRRGDIVRFVLRAAPPLFLADIVQAQREINSPFQRVRAILLARPEDAEEVIVLAHQDL